MGDVNVASQGQGVAPASTLQSADVHLEAGRELQDLDGFKEHKRLKRDEMFDDDFRHFMKWLNQDIKKSYTKADFQRIERRTLLSLLAGYSLVIVAYIALFTTLPERALIWGPPLFLAALYLGTKAEVFHMRTHSPQNLTGWPALDRFVDVFGLALSGVSPNLFKRRHLAAHFNDVAILSKLFSNVWLSFTKVPISFYLQPWRLIGFLASEKFCKDELIKRQLLLVETFFFYCYIAALVTEIVVFNSYFLLCFHLLPGLVVAGSQVMGAFIVHSGREAINSFESNALMDHKTAKGLFKVPLWWYGLFNNNLFVNHAIHHANPQFPLKLITEDYERYHAYILENYKNVRYNRTLSHDLFQPVMDRMPEPGPLSYVVAFFVTLGCHAMITLAAMGLPIAPIVFEWAYVDWRVPLYSTRQERAALRVAFMEELQIPQRFDSIAEPNLYLRILYKRYLKFKGDLVEVPKAAA